MYVCVWVCMCEQTSVLIGGLYAYVLGKWYYAKEGSGQVVWVCFYLAGQFTTGQTAFCFCDHGHRFS